MLWRDFFIPTSKDIPSDAQIPSHRLMLRSGMIARASAGIYTWLPLGLRVLQKVSQIVREEQNRSGALEVVMPLLQAAELWQESGRYEDYGKEMLRVQDRHERGMIFGPTAEEQITDIFRRYIKSYKDLPKQFYQIHWKFRDEIRPRFGVMRGREFLMKDNYSFDLTAEAAKDTYWGMFRAYLRTFHRLGVMALPVKADAGPIGGDFSQEFHILAQTGESSVFYDEKFEHLNLSQEENTWEGIKELYAAAEEKHDPAACPIPSEQLKVARGIEVGHIFYFGTKYSEAMNAFVNGPDGALVPVEMGSYGIGISRVVAAIIEAHHDERGIKWPEAVAPFQIGLINLSPGEAQADVASALLYEILHRAGLETLYDDRDLRPGSKFADMDLIGLPWQVIVGERALAQGQVEVKNRGSGLIEFVPQEKVLDFLLAKVLAQK